MRQSAATNSPLLVSTSGLISSERASTLRAAWNNFRIDSFSCFAFFAESPQDATASSRCSGPLFDPCAAASRENDHRGAGGVIDRERKKKLTLDVDLFFHQHRFDRKLPHFHRQHPLSVRAHILWFFCEGHS